MSDAATTGARVLAALSRGRARAIEQAKERGARTERDVRRALDLDIIEGHPQRGRAARIARRLRGPSERQVGRILDALFCVSETARHDANT